ncbi:hypothetical protein ACNOYE_14320 [Nannocystaceae bacterium ST9]
MSARELRTASLAALGLLACRPEGESTLPIDEVEPPREGAEPVARDASPSNPGAPIESTAVPTSREWCGAIIDTRPRPLPRSSSFLLAWNEIRVASGRVAPGPIPLTEPDARLKICGSPTCEALMPLPIEFNEAGKISVGTVIAGDGETLLTIADISPFFANNQCANATQISRQAVGDLVWVWAEAISAPYRHHHGYGGYYGCYSQPGRHDVFVDVASGMVVLEIEHRAVVLELDASDQGGLHVTLSGCSDTLELAWTD